MNIAGLIRDWCGDKITIYSEGYYYCGDFIPGRFLSGKLESISGRITIRIDGKDITVDVHDDEIK